MSIAQRQALVSPRAGAKGHENVFTEEKIFGSSLGLLNGRQIFLPSEPPGKSQDQWQWLIKD